MTMQSINGAAASGAIAPRQSTAQDVRPTPEAQRPKVDAVPPPIKDVQASRQQLYEAVKVVNDFVKSLNNSLQFSIDDETGETVVKVIDADTKQVIKQFPSEEMLAIAKALDNIKGLLVHQKA